MDKDKRGFGGPPPKGDGKPPEMALTDDQKKAVKALFAKYDLGKLTKEQVKAIFKSLEESGVRGPGMRAAIEEAGMDPEKFWSLAHDGQDLSARSSPWRPAHAPAPSRDRSAAASASIRRERPPIS